VKRPHGFVFDAGVQAERTALAWQRTALALAVAAVGVGKLAASSLGPVAVVIAALGLAQALAVSSIAGRRYQAVHQWFTDRGDFAGIPDGGWSIAAMTASGVVVGLLALLFVLSR
jgi:putative membrane protein